MELELYRIVDGVSRGDHFHGSVMLLDALGVRQFKRNEKRQEFYLKTGHKMTKLAVDTRPLQSPFSRVEFILIWHL
jgi:hypothetical protein